MEYTQKLEWIVKQNKIEASAKRRWGSILFQVLVQYDEAEKKKFLSICSR